MLKTMQRGTEIVEFTYDGAGRLVKEGDKRYQYGWLDKVMAVEDAKTGHQFGSYEYGMDGQLSSATWGDKTDTFVWDGLALVNKNGEDILNDPAIGGGNLLAVGGSVCFNDMLGSTLGVMNEKNEFVSTMKNAFGQADKTSADNDFFTGKPYVEGLGYAFLFRNYRPDLGKWQTADPIGYPDGWNNLAYCNNSVMDKVDLYGCETLDAEPQKSPEIVVSDSAWNLLGDRQVFPYIEATQKYDTDTLKFVGQAKYTLEGDRTIINTKGWSDGPVTIITMILGYEIDPISEADEGQKTGDDKIGYTLTKTLKFFVTIEVRHNGVVQPLDNKREAYVTLYAKIPPKE